MFMDLDLAERLERTEGMIGASFADARNAVSPVGAMSRDFDGTTAIFDGADSPMTQTFGLGLGSVDDYRPADRGVLLRARSEYTARSQPVRRRRCDRAVG